RIVFDVIFSHIKLNTSKLGICFAGGSDETWRERRGSYFLLPIIRFASSSWKSKPLFSRRVMTEWAKGATVKSIATILLLSHGRAQPSIRHRQRFWRDAQ